VRYLITGGAGFIGSHLAEALVARGDQVVLLDDLSTGQLSNIERLIAERPAHARFVQGTALDPWMMGKLAAEVDAVFHLAASVGVHLVVARPLDCMVNNVRGTEVVLEAAAAHGRKVLFASTSEIYGKNAAGPLREDADRILGSTLKARWAYSTSKSVDETFVHGYWRQRGLPTVVARLFNCAGPRQRGSYGMVLPRFVRQALAAEELTVFGDGTQSRCFCHVKDTVQALMLLADTEAAVGDVFNVGSQNEISVRGLAELVIELTGSSSGIRFISYDEAYEPGFEDMERRLPDITKIARLTGWQPVRSLRQIVGDCIAYQMELAVAART
jgi:nucleoside-diphosphate-sugar epimerase